MEVKDYFKEFVGLTQSEAKLFMSNFLRLKYKEVVETEDYIFAIGKIPVALVAHLDTVYEEPVKNLFYDEQKRIYWSPEGLGADDRAGLAAIISIIQDGYEPCIILTCDEEAGGLGAKALGMNSCPFPQIKYLIQLDRRGKNDCVFYDVGTLEFSKYISSFGFIEQKGTYSDISFLCPQWEKCGVNLSVGYYYEHSYREFLKLSELENTIEKVKLMLEEAESSQSFTLEPYYNASIVRCPICHQWCFSFDLIPYIKEDNSVDKACGDCLVELVHWCERCGIPFESSASGKICRKCEEQKNE